jgi:hypothetical protein
MSFTTLSIVQKHLLSKAVGILDVLALPVTLTGEDWLELPHHNLEDKSDVVKWDVDVLPFMEGPVGLSGYTWSSLSSHPIVPESVLVVTSEALSTIYVEEKDYKVDYPNGRFRRVEGGSILDNQPVYIYGNYYSVFDSESDYELDIENGRIRRRSGSTIPDGATVLVDYRVTAGEATEELIQQAILEAEDLIIRLLTPPYTAASADQGLNTGATELALSLIARDLATESLSRRSTSDASGRAREWQNLSRFYEERAWQTLQPFLDRSLLRSPEKRTNG